MDTAGACKYLRLRDLDILMDLQTDFNIPPPGNFETGSEKSDHAIVYMSKDADESPPDEVYGENLSKRPIRIVPKTHRDKLDSESRINYAKVYTVEHNVKVWFIGEIAPELKRTLITDFDAAWYAKRQMTLA
jgi:hypothetical protein